MKLIRNKKEPKGNFSNASGEKLNRRTRKALLEAEQVARDPKVTKYSDVEEALEELKK